MSFIFRGYFALKSSKWKSIDAMERHYRYIILLLFISSAIFKLMTSWKIQVISDSDLEYWDISTWITLKESKHWLSAFFLISLIIIAFSTSSKSAFGRPPGIFIATLVLIYLYRYGSI